MSRARVAQLLIAALALVFGIRAAAAEDTLKIAIGQHGNWENSAPELGQRVGIFKKHGLMLDLLYTQGSAETMQAVISGSADIGIGVGTPAAMAAFSRGAPILALANHTTGAPAAYWYVPANSPIRSFKDAAGKTVGFSTTGSSSYTALLQLENLLGVSVKPVGTGNPASTYTQTMSGQVDVGWSSPPFGLEAAEQGKIRIIAHASDVPALRSQTVRLQITNKGAYATKRVALDRYIAAYRETIEWMYSDPAALKMYSDWVQIPEAISKRMRDEFYAEDELLPDRLSGVDAMTEEAIAFKYISAPLTRAQLKELFVYSKAFD
ncbi:MAG TPA: ABC transporter substrate-binding protein [Pseudolabrys sp.]|nr:ABC transporter substrate-binding protein [Pseudolabrys sp.]